jgi:hypothetical protein
MISAFNTNSKMGVCLAVYSPVVDGAVKWRTVSPFITTLGPTNNYFILSPSATGILTNGKLLPSRLKTIGETSNEVSLISKATVNQKERSVVTGVGGFSKFKDFDFSIFVSEDGGANKIYQS